MAVDFRRLQQNHMPRTIRGVTVERVETTKFRKRRSQTVDTTGSIKQAHQRLLFLRNLKQISLPSSIFRTFYRSTVESVLAYCISTAFFEALCTYANTQCSKQLREHGVPF